MTKRRRFCGHRELLQLYHDLQTMPVTNYGYGFPWYWATWVHTRVYDIRKDYEQHQRDLRLMHVLRKTVLGCEPGLTRLVAAFDGQSTK